MHADCRRRSRPGRDSAGAAVGRPDSRHSQGTRARSSTAAPSPRRRRWLPDAAGHVAAQRGRAASKVSPVSLGHARRDAPGHWTQARLCEATLSIPAWSRDGWPHGAPAWPAGNPHGRAERGQRWYLRVVGRGRVRRCALDPGQDRSTGPGMADVSDALASAPAGDPRALRGLGRSPSLGRFGGRSAGLGRASRWLRPPEAAWHRPAGAARSRSRRAPISSDSRFAVGWMRAGADDARRDPRHLDDAADDDVPRELRLQLLALPPAVTTMSPMAMSSVAPHVGQSRAPTGCPSPRPWRVVRMSLPMTSDRVSLSSRTVE